ncbi:hypothetical protein GGS24DRAFT_449621 [Hypoxylon argillaceum]|nr:hypothetical protein GGS24DRAFT_449621 [Hypoxylon argillaceum]
MALLGWSLILASVVYIAIRRPPLVETLIALCRRSPQIQQPPSTRSPSSTTTTNRAAGRGNASAISLVRQDAPVRRAEAKTSAETGRNLIPDIASPRSSEVNATISRPVDADIPVVTIAPSPPSSPSPQTTPKASASIAPASGSIPSFSLSPSTVIDPPASAAAVARSTAAIKPPAPPVLGPTASPAMSMPPPPPRLSRPPKLNNTLTTPASSSLLAAPPTARPSPLPNRQAQYDRQPGTSTLAPPPTHASKPSKPSRKVTLEPGHSPLDWARLANHPTADLRGLGPGAPASYLRVTPSMLRQQTGRRGKDAWTALGGRVYNMSPYLPFHPGGEPELLRAAGRDGTRLFGEIHPWVNYETMLSSCLIGLLVEEDEGVSNGEMEAMD